MRISWSLTIKLNWDETSLTSYAYDPKLLEQLSSQESCAFGMLLWISFCQGLYIADSGNHRILRWDVAGGQRVGWAVGSGWRKSWDPDVNKLLVLAKTLGRGELDSHEHVYIYIWLYISYMHPRPGILIRRPPHRGWLTMGHSSFGLNIMVGKPAVRCLSSMRMWRYASFHQSPSPARYRFQQSRWGEAGLAFFQENAAKWRVHEDATCVVDSCWFSELLFLQVLVWGLQPTQECSVGKGNPLIKTQKSQTFICF